MKDRNKNIYLPDPVEIMESQIERQIDLVDSDGNYPCVICGRKFKIETMSPADNSPSAPAECGRNDCGEIKSV